MSTIGWVVGGLVYLLIGVGVAVKIAQFHPKRSDLFAWTWGLFWLILLPINLGALIVKMGD